MEKKYIICILSTLDEDNDARIGIDVFDVETNERIDSDSEWYHVDMADREGSINDVFEYRGMKFDIKVDFYKDDRGVNCYNGHEIGCDHDVNFEVEVFTY